MKVPLLLIEAPFKESYSLGISLEKSNGRTESKHCLKSVRGGMLPAGAGELIAPDHKPSALTLHEL